jgi:hypothetical protein
MTKRGNRRGGQPIIIQNSTATLLERIPLDARLLNEEWLQKLIHHNPNVLPVNEIETGFTPLIPIGKEVSTVAGNIDNLFISPEGYLTIIETKLWRNPEARREVVGQIIDYAKELNKWTFDNLDNSVKTFNQLYNKSSDGLLVTVRKHIELDETDEQTFIDNISKNLKRGRFLLLIVGDGIRESVEDMVEYLSQSPQLYFTLALIELQIYNLNKFDNSKIIIPQLVTRTTEITRAIVKIEGSSLADLKINVETDLATELINGQSQANSRLTITAQDYFEQLEKHTNKETVRFANQVIKDCENLGLIVEWNTGSFGVKFPDPNGSGIRISIFNVERTGWLYLGFSKGQFERLNIPLEISYKFAADTAAMFRSITPHPIQKHRWAKYSNLADLTLVYKKFMDRIKQYIEEITNEEQRAAAKSINASKTDRAQHR